MITIDKHISRLIALHDCVIVPGLGAFLAQRIPAYYNAEEQIFMPPHRTLCFNPHITMDDALLTTAYMQHYGTSYNQATAQLKEDIKKLKNNLSRNGEYYLGELGKMSMDIDGNIAFT
ncbi:MAG: SPOR domain-containing protein, partial [Bacteroidaceae bacterium]|nr:SPOR domain-containing protein [Bacteroidaceae bacterium]